MYDLLMSDFVMRDEGDFLIYLSSLIFIIFFARQGHRLMRTNADSAIYGFALHKYPTQNAKPHNLR